MFIRASTLLLPVIALSSVVVAAPEPVARGGSSCSNGTLQCCDTTYAASYLALLLSEMAVNQFPVHS